MKTFSEFLAEQEQLEEGVIRAGAITSYGAQSRRYGNEAAKAFRSGQQALQRGSARGKSAEERLERIESALDALLSGLIQQRQQIGAGVAVDVAGHMLAAKVSQRR